MEGFTLPLAIVDIVPVVIFLLWSTKTTSLVHDKMNRTQYAMFSGGMTLMAFGAISKVIWKFMYVLKICNYVTLDEAFFPAQAVAFLLMSIAFHSYLYEPKILKKHREKIMTAIIPIPIILMALVSSKGKEGEILDDGTVGLFALNSHLIFILMMTVGMSWYIALMIITSKRIKNKTAIIFSALAYVGLLMTCYASSGGRVAIYHWIAESGNIISDLFLLFAVQKITETGIDSLENKAEIKQS